MNHSGEPFPVAVRGLGETPKRKIFDWLSEPHPEDLSPFQRWFVGLDWSNSPLGQISAWPLQLRQMVLLVMCDPTPAVIYWGEENTIVYNEPYIQLIGRKHPALQGQDPRIGFAEVWDHFETMLAKQRENGETSIEANAPLLFHRHGFLEETYFSWKFVPITGPEGWIVGSHATVVEVTREVISDRRLSIVRSLSRHLSEASTVCDLWTGIIRGFENSEKDVPFALLYAVADSSGASKTVSSPDTPRAPDSLVYNLKASVGIPEGHLLAPSRVQLQSNTTSLSLHFIEAMERMSPVVMAVTEEALRMMEEVKWRGYGVPPTKVVVCPIIQSNSTTVVAFLVIALNPRRPYDEDYQDFINLITQQVTTPQLNAVVLREEVKRRQQLMRQEAIDRDRLHKELSESESKFARFATRAPLGMAILRPDGTLLSANDLWRDLTQLEVGSNQVDWGKVLVEGELEPMLGVWGRLVIERNPVTMQTMINRPWKAPDLDRHGNEQSINTHILFTMYPDLDEQGEVATVMSCITDITSLKWTEYQLRRRMDQAIEMKKQQERFIDMTSHEMRNPLSALIGCADEILSSLNEYRTAVRNSDLDSRDVDHLHLLDEAAEAADIIIYCAMHQKRIIDDILTLSRLDSNLLLVSPEASQPLQLVQSALKMFEAELKRADTRLEFIEEESLKTLQIQWTLLDPSRVLQVLINLMTNAIKFTRLEENRQITVTMGASLTRPSETNEFGVQYVQKSLTSPDQTMKAEWGDGEVIYISIAVRDTGRGLSEKEKKNLFHIFKQASPKTYTQYGGSGLGLFISRQLVEMQGGEIGVASEAGQGSTFQFYLKTRRTAQVVDAPQKPDFQLLVREDALREACATEMPAHHNGTTIQNIESEITVHMQPTVDTSGCFHILVVEDNLVNQKVVTKQLRKAGHVVYVANHGEEALDFIRRSEYWHAVGTDCSASRERLSIILMDLEMPIMDGITCVTKIRELQRQGKIKGHVPVIAVTANARKDQIMKSLDAGMDDVTTKPYRIQNMLQQIEKVAAKYRTRTESGIMQALTPV